MKRVRDVRTDANAFDSLARRCEPEGIGNRVQTLLLISGDKALLGVEEYLRIRPLTPK